MSKRGGRRHSPLYVSYMGSRRWRRKRERVRARSGDRCEWRWLWWRCDRPARDVHHKTYERLGDEPLRHLAHLCDWHHELEDAKRSRRRGVKPEPELGVGLIVVLLLVVLWVVLAGGPRP